MEGRGDGMLCIIFLFVGLILLSHAPEMNLIVLMAFLPHSQAVVGVRLTNRDKIPEDAPSTDSYSFETCRVIF